MSDRNDFVKDSNLNSYEACLDSIADCDYYLLLIGSRVGGLYSTDPKISITQQEYRCANELAKQGEIKKLFIFVRKNLWDIKEDRKALERLLKSEYQTNEDLSEKENDIINKSLYHKSKFINDAKFIFSFIDEVSKSKEMKKALEKDISEFPSHNWINTFSDFKDIIDVLKAELRIEFSLNRKRLDELICENLSTILSLFLTRNFSGSITANYYSVKDVLAKFPESENVDYEITKRQGEKLFIFAIIDPLDMSGLSYGQLQAAVQSGIYLDYDTYKSDYRASVAQRALSDLINNLDIIKNLSSLVSNYDYIQKIEKILKTTDENPKENLFLNSSNPVIMPIIQTIRCHHNVIELCRYLFAYLKDICKPSYPEVYGKKLFKFSTDDIIFPRLSPEEIYDYMINP